MFSNDKLKSVIKYVAPLTIVAWGAATFPMLLDTGNLTLLYLYQFYLAYLIGVSIYYRENLFHPVGIGSILGFLAFGNTIPLLCHGYIADLGSYDPRLMADTLIVFLAAQFAFSLGALIILPGASIPFGYLFDSKFEPVKVGVIHLIALAAVVALCGAFRIRFNIGAAKELPGIPYAGYFHFAMLDGLLFCTLWYMSRTFGRNIWLTLFSFIPLLGIVFTQALLGWRGTIFHVLICVAALFWFQKKIYRNERVRSFGWIVLIGVIGFSAIQLGQVNRARVIKSDDTFATNVIEFVEKVQARSQGTTRLATVIDYFGQLSMDNNWRIISMIERNESAADYINEAVYGIQTHQKHSIGCSGPGSSYVGAGLIGVVFGYFFWGIFYRAVYEQIQFDLNKPSNVLAIAFYAMLVGMLLNSFAETFSLHTIKKLIAVTAIAFTGNIFLFHSNKLKRRTGLSRGIFQPVPPQPIDHSP